MENVEILGLGRSACKAPRVLARRPLGCAQHALRIAHLQCAICVMDNKGARLAGGASCGAARRTAGEWMIDVGRGRPWWWR
eukprot:scaffold29441_cov33-Tisochrysis_lutea.AAC.2